VSTKLAGWPLAHLHELSVDVLHVLLARLLNLIVSITDRVNLGSVRIVVDKRRPVEEGEGSAKIHVERNSSSHRLDVLDVQQTLNAALKSVLAFVLVVVAVQFVDKHVVLQATGFSEGSHVDAVVELRLEFGHCHRK